MNQKFLNFRCATSSSIITIHKLLRLSGKQDEDQVVTDLEQTS